MTATAATERMWVERVQSWRESGESAESYADGKGFAGSTLRFWASRLGRTASAPRLVQLVPKTAPKPSAAGSVAVEIEVGGACVRVTSGFDREVLAEVIGVLRGSAR